MESNLYLIQEENVSWLTRLLIDYGVNLDIAPYLSDLIMVLFIVVLSILGNVVTKRIVLRYLYHYIKNNKFKWDDIMMERKVFQRLANIVPALIIYSFAPIFSVYQQFIQKGALIYIFIVAMYATDSFLDSINDIYRTYDVSKIKPIKGYIQVIKIFVYIVGGIVIIATLLGESPVILLSGIGALTAVLMLVFKDSILGLVAGIQLASNDMVRIGDWIEMPKYGADGDVIDISLNTVKVENFDKTITTLPTYVLISDSFKNWRGMQNAGGRRIKRSIYIDTTSIAFCTEEMIEKFKNIHYLTEHIIHKQKEIVEYNIKNNVNKSNIVNGRQLTNIGIFRAYIQNYLKNHPKIHKGMVLMVRQLAPGENGLPLEIYAFTNDTNWVNYETAQADIFDHILAVAPEFGLRVFQNPTGYDFKYRNSSL